MRILNVLKEKKNRIIKKIANWYLKKPEEIVDPMEPWEIAHWELEEKLQKKHKKLKQKYTQKVKNLEKQHNKMEKKIIAKYGKIE